VTARPLLLITGASRGIGRAIAERAASRGYDLVLTYHSDRVRADDVAAAARAHGAAVTTAALDLADHTSIAALFDALQRPLAGVVNNAAFVGARGPLQSADIDDLSLVLTTNVRGTALVCRAAIPRLQAGGVLVTLSSQSAQFGGNGLSVYAASKAALNGLTISLAREIAPQGLRAVAVSPGPVLTEPLLALPPERLAEMAASLPMGRFCTVDDVARTVLWLLSEEAGYISGAVVPVYGAR
jgi:NAD(P)-dependent dehydrogenase (short-subunit alcohol dehydrogenase family)